MQTIKYALLFGCGLLLTLCRLPAKTQTSAAPLEKTVLWEVSGKGLPAPSYLFGTIHAVCSQDLAITEDIKSRLGAAGQLYLELDLDDPNMLGGMQGLMSMQGLLFMKDGVTLETLLSKEDYQLVDGYFSDSLGIPLGLMKNIKPFFLTSMMLPAVMDCQPASWETSLAELAKAKGTEVKGLETVEEQLAFFDNISYQDQAAMLVEGLRNADKSKEEFSNLLNLYKQGDIEGLQKIVTAQSSGLGKYDQLLVTERNNRWVPLVEKAAREKSTFFAVGAGHLGGPEGMVRLLRKAGYTVTPVLEGAKKG
jgi:uncharacterized protein YbaP (TraB family)